MKKRIFAFSMISKLFIFTAFMTLVFLFFLISSPNDAISVSKTFDDEVNYARGKFYNSFSKIADTITEPLKENEIVHQGSLKIRILNGTEAVSFIATAVSCAVNDPLERFKATTEKSVLIGDCESAYINCQLNQKRWLLDKFAYPKILENYNIEINGKVIPTKFVEDTENGKSSNYFVLLRRVN